MVLIPEITSVAKSKSAIIGASKSLIVMQFFKNHDKEDEKKV
jgi:hypothetical protein